MCGKNYFSDMPDGSIESLATYKPSVEERQRMHRALMDEQREMFPDVAPLCVNCENCVTADVGRAKNPYGLAWCSYNDGFVFEKEKAVDICDGDGFEARVCA